MGGFEQILEATSLKNVAMQPLTSHLKPSKKDEQDMWDTPKGYIDKLISDISYELLHMDGPVLTDQWDLTNISSVRTLDAV